MKNKKNILIPIIMIMIIIIIIIIIVGSIIKSNIDNKLIKYENILINEIQPEDYNKTEEEKIEINEIEQNFGIKGNSELYEIQEDLNNIKVVTIKPSIKYKVAFTGMIKNNLPKIEEIDSVIEQHHPKYAGIWINEKDKEKILELIKKITNSNYFIDNNGYLKIEDKNKQNDNDKKLEKIIYGEKLYILSISNICYIVDDVTGEILDYNFEKIDKYQTYECFEDNDKMIIFINENTNRQLEENEIIESIVELLSISLK